MMCSGAEFLQNLTNEVEENSEAMEEGEFVFNEFIKSLQISSRLWWPAFSKKRFP